MATAASAATPAKKEKKLTFKVVGYAMTKNERDITVLVKAANAKAAREAAVAEEPSLDKHKDVRIYSRSAEWVRVE